MKTYTIRFREQDKISFDAIRDGSKPIETRAATVKYQPIAPGDELRFVCAREVFSKTVSEVYRWSTVDAMLREVEITKITPWIGSVEDMKKMYASFPGYDEKIKQFGLIGFSFE